jgi:hypothetical protein
MREHDMSDANVAKKIREAAIYAARSPEGESSETRGGSIYRYRRDPWLIVVHLRRDPETPQADILVTFNRQAVFHAVGQIAEPEVVTFTRGEWEAQLLENWGPHPDAP